jgi:hypothetical protein
MRVIVGVLCVVACGFPRPPRVGDGDAGVVGPVCTGNAALRCDGASLVRCNADGTGEVSEACALGCNAGATRCFDVNPSNGLATYLDMAAAEPDLDLGMKATIDTDTGAVTVDGQPVVVHRELVAQSGAPTIRVFIVRSLRTGDVAITGTNALAIVSDRDVSIGGVFAASANFAVPGAGALSDAACKGGNATIIAHTFSGAGGGGFGSSGGAGGTATTRDGVATGGANGQPTGNSSLVPLRGGCDGGISYAAAGLSGAGGGAVQLVSRTTVSVTGTVAVNGGAYAGAGGSGGGALLEAPFVVVGGHVVANGGSGGGGCPLPGMAVDGEPGHLDATAAVGGTSCDPSFSQGGNGGARDDLARNALDAGGAGATLAAAGHGGGSVGRIRVNSVSGGLHSTGVFSPNPSTGPLAVR